MFLAFETRLNDINSGFGSISINIRKSTKFLENYDYSVSALVIAVSLN